jgi:hypothetical protein
LKKKICLKAVWGMSSHERVHDPVPIPLDAWQQILGQMEMVQAISAFENLWIAGVFGKGSRIDTFWSVIMTARRHMAQQEPFQNLPDATPYQDVYARLLEMGIGEEHANAVMRQSGGSWGEAMISLGWD